MARLNKQERFFLFGLVLVLVGLGVIAFFWNGTGFYERSYTPMVERAKRQGNPLMRGGQMHAEEAPRSSQPRAAGFKESDIEKNRGNGYSTY